MSNLQVAETILQQLGGTRFTIMTGAHNLCGDIHALSFRLPGALAKNRINYVRITLTPADTYTVEFFAIRGTKITSVSKHDDVYFDSLQSLFTSETGLDTHL